MSTPESKLVNFIDAQVEKRLQKILTDMKGVEFKTILENALKERNRLREQVETLKKAVICAVRVTNSGPYHEDRFDDLSNYLRNILDRLEK
jgi:hypothetical protein